MRMLPTFKGYTVDFRLRQFRKAEYGKALEFIDFDSEEGQRLLDGLEAEMYEAELEHAARMLAQFRRKRQSPLDPFYWLDSLFKLLLSAVEYGVTAIVGWVFSKISRKRRR